MRHSKGKGKKGRDKGMKKKFLVTKKSDIERMDDKAGFDIHPYTQMKSNPCGPGYKK